jgi:hypothetical protein
MRKERDVYEVEVGAARPTRHSVTAGAGDVERLTGGKEIRGDAVESRKIQVFFFDYQSNSLQIVGLGPASVRLWQCESKPVLILLPQT